MPLAVSPGVLLNIGASAGVLRNPVVSTFDTSTIQMATDNGAGGFDIVHRGVTFTFSTQVSYILSPAPLSEPIVITHSDYMPSGTTLTGTTPASQLDADGRQKNGAMVNPLINTNAPPLDGPSWNPDYGQGFDGLAQEIGGGSSNDSLDYVSAMDDDPAVAGPLSIATGYKGCFVKSIRDPNVNLANVDNNKGPMQKYVVLSFMDSLPPSAGTWFRQGISLTSAQRTWRPTHTRETVLSQIDYTNGLANGILRDLANPGGVETPSTALSTRIVTGDMQTLGFFAFGQGDRTRRVQISREQPTTSAYTRELGRERAEIHAALHLATGGSQTEIDAKRDICMYEAQWAIDLDACVQRGLTYGKGAGQHYGNQPIAYIGAFCLNDATMVERARSIEGNSIDQCFWLVSDLVAYPQREDPGSAGANAKVLGETYGPEDVGIPEWSTDGIVNPNLNSNLNSLYRDTIFGTQFQELIPICLLRNGPSGETGDDAIRGSSDYTSANSRAAAIAHMDRLITIDPWKNASTTNPNAGDPADLYNAWRPHFTSTTPLWTGRPDVPHNPTDYPDWTVSGAANETIAWDATQFDFTTLPITDQQAQVSHDGIHFVDATAVNAGNTMGTAATGTLTGLRPGNIHVRWRRRNADRSTGNLDGWSKWSPTWWMAHSDSSNASYAKYKTNRNQFTVPGTASGTFTQRAAPNICYKPFPAADEQRFYKELVGGEDLSQISTLYAGMGYWTGGTGTLSATYQWQRSSDGSTGWANCGGTDTAQAYARTSSDVGKYVRCNVTVSHAGGNSGVISTPAAFWPAATTFPSTTLLKTRFDAMLPYEWPAAYGSISATNGTLVHLPQVLYAGDHTYRGAIINDKTSGSGRAIQIQASNGAVLANAPTGTYYYKIVCMYGGFPTGGNNHAIGVNGNYILKVSSGSGGTGTTWVNETISFATNGDEPQMFSFEGTFDVLSSAPIFIHYQSNSSGTLGAPGLYYAEIKVNGT